jgi:DNA-directed RNA polymerase specialized sigma24 family protein
LTYDEYEALERAGYNLLGVNALLGVTDEQMDHLRHSTDPDARYLANVFAEAQRHHMQKFRRAFPIQWDVLLLAEDLRSNAAVQARLSDSIPVLDDARLAACNRLIKLIPWRVYPSDTGLKEALVRRARAEGRGRPTIKEDELRQALPQVVGRLSDQRYARLTWEDRWRTIKNDTIGIAAESLLEGRPRVRSHAKTSRTEGEVEREVERELPREVPFEEAGQIEDEASPDPLHVILDKERREGGLHKLSRLPKRESELVHSLLQGRTINEASAELGISPDTARIMLYRIKQKLTESA